jgi:hypothetical protein
MYLLQNSPELGKLLAITPESLHPQFGNKYDHNLDRDTFDAAPNSPSWQKN